MAKHDVHIGQTDYSVLVFIRDSTSSSGAPKTGLDHTKVDFSYTRVETDNDVVVTGSINPASLASLTAAHTDWGFKEVDAPEAPGLYRLDIADQVFASGAWSAVVSIRDAGSNNVAPVALEFQLVGQSPLNNGVNLTHIDGQATNGNNATLNLKKLNIVNSNGTALVARSTGGSGYGAEIAGHESAHGARFVGGASSGSGFSAEGGALGNGALLISGSSGGAGLVCGVASPFGVAVFMEGGAMGIHVQATDTAINIQGGVVIAGIGNDPAVKLQAETSGHALELSGGTSSGDASDALWRGAATPASAGAS
jgi:hypothetical protein